MSSAKTIQIYCPTGDPRGIRIAEITTRIVQAIATPRARLEEAAERQELQGVGIYFLFGESETSGLPRVYIGEAEDCAARLKQHNRSNGKDFWNSAVAIISRTGSLTKAHVRLLEWMAIEKAKAANRYELDNGNAGIKPTVPEWMAADAAEIFETADVLLSTLGHPLFEGSATPTHPAQHLFYCRRSGTDARGLYNDDGFVVLAGSLARPDVAQSAPQAVSLKREELIATGVLTPSSQGYQLTRDLPFSSPSAAACFIIGGRANGWAEWKNAHGQTLDEVYRQPKTG